MHYRDVALQMAFEAKFWMDRVFNEITEEDFHYRPANGSWGIPDFCNHLIEHYNWIIGRQFLGDKYEEYKDQTFTSLKKAKEAVYAKHEWTKEIVKNASEEQWNTLVKGKFSDYPRIQVCSQAYGHVIWHCGQMRELLHFSTRTKK